MTILITEYLIYISIILIILSKNITYISFICLISYIFIKLYYGKKTNNIYTRDLTKLLNKDIRNKNIFLILAFCVLILSIIDWWLQFIYSSRISNISNYHIIIYGIFGVSVFCLFNWNTPLLEYWRINFVDNVIIKNFKLMFLENLRDIDLLNVESLQKTDIYHIINTSQYHLKTSVRYLQYTYKYIILVLVSFMGICIFSPLWGLKMFVIVFIINIFIIYPNILDIQSKKRNLIKKKINIDRDLSYLLDDYKNIVHYSKINRPSLHNNFMNNISNKESLLDADIDKKWNFTLFKFLILTRFVYFSTWINAIITLQKLPVITTTYAIKTVMGISFAYKISSYTNEVLLNFINYIISTEDYHIIERIKFPNKQFSRFIHKMNNNIRINYPNIFLFDQKLVKKYIYITGESGKGKTTLLRSLFYLNKELWNKTVYIDQDSKFTLENIICSEFIMGFEVDRNIELVEKAIQTANLQNKFQINTLLKNPSGGERQRLKLARYIYQAYLIKPDIIIMDEPDTGLDYNTFKTVILNFYREFPKCKFIFTSHKKNVINDLKLDIQIIKIP